MRTDISTLNTQRYDDMESYGGLVGGMPIASRVPAIPATIGKRSNRTDQDPECQDDDDEERRKRSRGRPRLDTKDETAADRRRTQIRLAQRAYRHRKDTAITTLEQKVKDLQHTNDEFGKEFSNFYDLLLADGLPGVSSHASGRLRSAAESLLRLTRKPAERSLSPNRNENFTALYGSTGNTESGSDSPERKPSIPDSAFPSDSAIGPEVNSSSSFSSSTPSVELPTPLPYEIITQPTPDNASFPFYASMESQSQDNYLYHISTHSPYSNLSAPRSYASHERTFGRRLQRSTLESGLKLVSMSNPPPERYAAVFGFCLLFESRDAILCRLAAGLSRTQQQSLDYWKVPFTNLGGTGLHFPNNGYSESSSGDASGNRDLPIGNQGTYEIDKPQNVTGFSMGPFDPQIEFTRKERLDNRMRITCQGFEGEFFDSDEIEIYLRQIGITIPQHAEFVEAEIDIGDLRDTADSTSCDRPINQPHHFADPGVTSASIQGADMRSAMNSSDSSLPSSIHPSGLNRMWTPVSDWTKRKVTISVSILIDEMVRKSVCLGRTSGVRPKDVNMAVKIAAGLYGQFSDPAWPTSVKRIHHD